MSAQIHFIGCGGIGMCGLAMLSLQPGSKVSGSDIKISKNTELLCRRGADVKIGHSVKNLPENDNYTVVYSSAIANDNPELVEARKRGVKCYRRGEYLALIAEKYKRVVSIAGSHGKTTVTAMTAHILKQFSDINPGYLIGGWPVDCDALGEAGDGDIFVIEVDESDLSLALMHSHIGIVLNLDDDHSWSVGGIKELEKGFLKFAEQSKLLLYPENKKLETLFKDISTPKKVIDLDSDIETSCRDRRCLSENNKQCLSSGLPKDRRALFSNLWGKYQKNNAAIAVNAAVELGIPMQKAVEALKTFQGVERRMQKRFSDGSITILEDYAHHPVEVKASVDAVREAYPNKKLTIIFQPHRYSRLKLYFREFTEELNKADMIFVVPVFSAWSSMAEISSEDLVNNIGKNAVSLNGSWEGMAEQIMRNSGINDSIILVMGAGDVNEIIPALLCDICSGN